MRRLLLLLLLLSLSFAEFRMTALDVLADVGEDGSAQVTERMHFIITTSYHQSLYESTISKNDLASWSSATGSEEVRSHFDNRYVEIDNVVVSPAPLSNCNALADLCHGELVITYTLEPYFDSEGEAIPGTGIFTMDEYKPRTVKYSLNSEAIYFEGSELGDVILGESVRLTLLLPERAELVEVRPVPDEEVTGGATQLSWTNRVLSHFTCVFEIEDSLDQEVVGFFVGTRGELSSLLYGPEGIAILALVAIVIGAYFFLQTKVKR